MKRATDLVLAVLLLALTCPVLFAAMVAIVLTMGRPVIFSQARTGLGMHRFALHKLRTMSDARDADGVLRPDSVRLTRLGRFLRRSSIDELPSLINVVRGELSLVGPRPLLPRYEQWYSARERLRFTVRPGITGLAQISGRNVLAWNDRLELDVCYVEQRTYPLDLRIMVSTLGKTLVGSGTIADPAVLMPDLDAERAALR
ncbi:MAG TPA: sugar transferase [Actinoplanes sp.]|jgi:lipopolysaccharide/colanic/teichoic acid biosynthesis glycosyltransferase